MAFYPNNSKKKPNPNYIPPASIRPKGLFCKHANNEVVCWHWTHGIDTNEVRFLEIQLKCNDCGKYHFAYIYDWNKCDKFISEHKDKFWSSNCQPVL